MLIIKTSIRDFEWHLGQNADLTPLDLGRNLNSVEEVEADGDELVAIQEIGGVRFPRVNRVEKWLFLEGRAGFSIVLKQLRKNFSWKKNFTETIIVGIFGLRVAFDKSYVNQ